MATSQDSLSSVHQNLVTRVQHLLSSQPPAALTSSGSSCKLDSAQVISQLLQPDILNGSEEDESLWCALGNTPAPAPHHAALQNDSKTIDPLLMTDVEGACVSFPLDGTVDQINETPYEIVSAIHVNSDVEGGDSTDAAAATLLQRKLFRIPADQVTVMYMWWGYQIFLPELVMQRLGNDVEPFLDGISYLSSALTFLVTKAPPLLSAVPGAALISSIGLPVISAISGTLNLSWKVVKAQDRHGQGVILAATWVMPVAVIPRPLSMKDWSRPAVAPSRPPARDCAGVEGDGGAELVESSSRGIVARKKSVTFAEDHRARERNKFNRTARLMNKLRFRTRPAE